MSVTNDEYKELEDTNTSATLFLLKLLKKQLTKTSKLIFIRFFPSFECSLMKMLNKTKTIDSDSIKVLHNIGLGYEYCLLNHQIKLIGEKNNLTNETIIKTYFSSDNQIIFKLELFYNDLFNLIMTFIENQIKIFELNIDYEQKNKIYKKYIESYNSLKISIYKSHYDVIFNIIIIRNKLIKNIDKTLNLIKYDKYDKYDKYLKLFNLCYIELELLKKYIIKNNNIEYREKQIFIKEIDREIKKTHHDDIEEYFEKIQEISIYEEKFVEIYGKQKLTYLKKYSTDILRNHIEYLDFEKLIKDKYQPIYSIMLKKLNEISFISNYYDFLEKNNGFLER
jgi:hypothetical protein